MVDKIDVAKFFENQEDRVLIDVRTPAEYEQGHIAGAHNLPLFSNEERAIVGTIYKKKSPEMAMLKGLEFVGEKLPTFVKIASKIAPRKKVAVYCWRGGKRSGSLSWLLDLAGFDVITIQGGYKAYRTFMFDFYQQPLLINTVGGRTGTGKTEIIHHLKDLGEQVVDLEGIAHHKGSAFGALGEQKQPTVEHFENILFNTLIKLDLSKKVWVENESRSIGRVFIPHGFWDNMKRGRLINIEIPYEERIERSVTDYKDYPKDELIAIFKLIEKRLGGQLCQAAIEALNKDDYKKAAEIALIYYDKSYQFSLENNITIDKHYLVFNHSNMLEIAKEVMKY